MRRAPASFRALPWLLLALAVGAAPASADKPRLRLERVDPSQLGDGKLRAYASVVELEGTVVENLNPGEFSLFIDNKPAGRATGMARFSASNEEVDVAFVVETAAQYKKAIEPVKAALKDFLNDQPRQFKAMLITYGSDVEMRSPLAPAASLEGPLDELAPEDDSADVKMVEAVQMAIRELKKLKPREGQAPARRLIVLVSDGLNQRMDRKTFKDLGTEARRSALPIHTLAFSPGDERGPLLNLGDISKRSNGTFRWARTQADLTAQLGTLAEEVRRQYVLTFKSSLDKLHGHNFYLRMDNLVSNRLYGDNELGPDGFGTGTATGGGWSWWMWLLSAVGVLFALWLLGTFIQWRQSRGAAPPRPGVVAPKPAAGKPPTRPSPVVAAPPARAPVAAARAALVAIGGSLAGQRFEVRPPLTVGKVAGNSIVIGDDPTVSSRHLEIGRDAAGFYLKDLGSTNGTFVNNTRIAAVHRLVDGDIVRLGQGTQFKVRLD